MTEDEKLAQIKERFSGAKGTLAFISPPEVLWLIERLEKTNALVEKLKVIADEAENTERALQLSQNPDECYKLAQITVQQYMESDRISVPEISWYVKYWKNLARKQGVIIKP